MSSLATLNNFGLIAATQDAKIGHFKHFFMQQLIQYCSVWLNLTFFNIKKVFESLLYAQIIENGQKFKHFILQL